MGIFQSIFLFLRALMLGRAAVAFENLALRQQVAVFQQSVKRPKLRPRNHIFWIVLSRLWPNWRTALAIVQPETVVRWHRKGFKLFWQCKSRAGKPGRPPIERAVRDLIRRMSRENPTWGAPRTLSELRPNRSSMPSRTKTRRVFCFAIAMVSTATTSGGVSRTWTLKKSSSQLADAAARRVAFRV